MTRLRANIPPELIKRGVEIYHELPATLWVPSDRINGVFIEQDFPVTDPAGLAAYDTWLEAGLSVSPLDSSFEMQALAKAIEEKARNQDVDRNR